MSVQNMMDPGPLPQGLPVLTTVKEMLIARVHVFMEVHQVCGQQYKYSGHVCNFLRDIGKDLHQATIASSRCRDCTPSTS